MSALEAKVSAGEAISPLGKLCRAFKSLGFQGSEFKAWGLDFQGV